MPTIGLRYPVYSPLTEDDVAGTHSYGVGKVAAKAVKVDMSLNIAESVFYADDAASESVKEFVDGTMTFTPDELSAAVKKEWLDNKTETATVGTEQVEVLISTDEDLPGYFGFGFILPQVKSGTRMYRAIIFTKVQFGEPNESVETKGTQINWQTPTIQGKLFRRIDGAWKKEITVSSLATAKAWLAQELNIGGGSGA